MADANPIPEAIAAPESSATAHYNGYHHRYPWYNHHYSSHGYNHHYPYYHHRPSLHGYHHKPSSFSYSYGWGAGR